MANREKASNRPSREAKRANPRPPSRLYVVSRNGRLLGRGIGITYRVVYLPYSLCSPLHDTEGREGKLENVQGGGLRVMPQSTRTADSRLT